MNTQTHTLIQELSQDDLKVIENWQTYIKKKPVLSSVATSTFQHTLRPFRKGQKRLETLTPQWSHNVSQSKLLTQEYQWHFLQHLEQQKPQEIEFLKKQIKRKLKSYYQQDLKKGIFESEKAITTDQTVQLLQDSFLECYYCQQKVKILYETVRDPLQWTLERWNNEHGHNRNNVVISCLKCNLGRRTMNSERYLKTKHMVSVEKIGDFTTLIPPDKEAQNEL